ncbi:MAG TPA: hypothetical protein VGM88_05000 [Kofleriaceae bacterium]|jgi:hypothetical protein
MKRLVVVALAACSSSSSPPPAAPAPTPAPAAPEAPEVQALGGVLVAASHPGEPYVGTTCNRFLALQGEKCSPFDGRVHITWETCIQALGGDAAVLVPASNELRPMAECAISTTECDPFVTCLQAHRDDLLKTFRPCNERDNPHPAGVTAAEYASHNGAALHLYRDVRSTKAAPIERCGVVDANAWLASLECIDGSHPLLAPGDAKRTNLNAERVRVGNVGEGGRCFGIIDLYRIGCPNEPDWDIYIDSYICPDPSK